MSKEEIEYTIKTDRNIGEIMFSRGDYSFKQWGLRHEIIDLIDDLQQENKQLKDKWNKLKEELKGELLFDQNWYDPEKEEYTQAKHFLDDTLDGFRYVLDRMIELDTPGNVDR